MALDWVQKLLAECLGFTPFPATLNMRPAREEDAAAWESIRNDAALYSHMPAHQGSCLARIYRVRIETAAAGGSRATAGAVLLPEVKGYPKDKIEIVASMRLKDVFGLQDGDPLRLEFFN